MHHVSISLVSTVLNDRDGAQQLLKDLRRQSRIPDEFVVLDGGSTDGTFELLEKAVREQPYNLRVLQERGANVSRGRNLAIEHAQHDIILTTDFGCRLHPDWVSELAAPFENDPSLEIVTGSWKILDEDIQTPAEWAAWALANGRLEVIATPTCLASTRSLAFRRKVWLDFGRYPEDLSLAGDDAIFSLWMVKASRKIAAAPWAMCYWHRFRKLKSYFKEARRNFQGAGEAIFFLSYGVKVGLCLVFEYLTVAAFLAALGGVLLGLPLNVLALSALAAAIVWSRRLMRWASAARLLHPKLWPWIVALEVGTRFHGVVGYWIGFFRGFAHCGECRKRMRVLNISRW